MSQNLLENIMNDKDSNISYFDLKQQLLSEMEKPIDEQDFDLIKELDNCIIEITQNNIEEISFDKNNINDRISKIKRISHLKKNVDVNRKIKIPKFLVASLTIVFMISAYSLFLISNNPEDHILSNSTSDNTEIILPVKDSDPYGLKNVCYNNGMNEDILTPDYIPDTFKLVAIADIDDISDAQTEMSSGQTSEQVIEETTAEQSSETSGFNGFFDIYNTDTISEECSNFTQFIYEDSESSINISIEQYISEMSAYLSIDESKENIKTLDIQGKQATVYKETDENYNIEFCSGNMVYRLQTENIEYDTVLKIAESFV